MLEGKRTSEFDREIKRWPRCNRWIEHDLFGEVF